MGEHAKLSPSKSSQWLACPGSVALCSDVVEVESRAANLGTAAHKLFEQALKSGLPASSWLGQRIDDVLVTAEMVSWVQDALDWVTEYVAKHPEAMVYSEETVEIGVALGLPKGVLWGTCDLFILTTTELVVFDLKTGIHEVEVSGNSQLHLYGLGFLHALKQMHSQVRFVIHQPRSGGAKEEVVPMAVLSSLRDVHYAPKAKRALMADAPRIPGDEQCRWCPAATLCPELHQLSVEVAKREFAPVHTLNMEQLLWVLDKSEAIRRYLNATAVHAAQLLQLGQSLPGWKVVAGKKHRVWKDEDEAQKWMNGLGVDATEKVLLSPAQAEAKLAEALRASLPSNAKALASAKMMLGDHIITPAGDATLVRDSDPRPALPPDFAILSDGKKDVDT